MTYDDAMHPETTVTLREALRELHRHDVFDEEEIAQALEESEVGNGEYSSRDLLIFLGY